MLLRACALILGGALVLVPFVGPGSSAPTDFLSAVKTQLVQDGVSPEEAERAAAWLSQPEHHPNPIGEGDLGAGYYYIFYTPPAPVDVLGLPDVLPDCYGLPWLVVSMPTTTRGGPGTHYAMTESALGTVPLIGTHNSFEATGTICQFSTYWWLLFSGVFSHD